MHMAISFPHHCGIANTEADTLATKAVVKHSISCLRASQVLASSSPLQQHKFTKLPSTELPTSVMATHMPVGSTPYHGVTHTQAVTLVIPAVAVRFTPRHGATNTQGVISVTPAVGVS